MSKLNERNYIVFSAEERIRLAIAAMARNDTQELDRLWHTAKVKLYSARDLEYKDRFQQVAVLSTTFFQHCVYWYNKIILVEWHTAEGIADDQLQEKINVAKDVLIARLKAVYKALQLFCAQAILDYDDLLKTISFEGHCDYIQHYLAEDIEPDERHTEMYRQQFLTCWQFNRLGAVNVVN